ncbi:Ribosome-associated factor Y [Oceanibacterium hippocampi]|uniref:Ribosome hibernation promoting factor n=1 Tax=Oceanibacterium hippocampi TaxID=745714 RepID=A0A1Y5RQN0_9PROT|nr:Ribosome-associated factor Y [Oceanibacterium hippocampi]
MRTHVEERLTSGTAKYFANALEASVTFRRDGHQFRAECSVHVGAGIDVAASAAAGDAYGSFDLAAERIEKQLRRYKRRLRSHRGNERADGAESLAQRYVLAAEEEGAEGEVAEEFQPLIVAESRTSIVQCTVGDAVMRMDLADEPVYLFRNIGNGALNVVYRRKDGNIGWIEPARVETGRA